ncbi:MULTISPECIES: GntR family transcriptional regulator [Micromonospora]|uniref:Regulatory protein, gntR family n=1 Tax=Micromonospora rifamycinica TaxID=291594 RepID=A0A109IJW7_9ACTN|nr:MULTISPECIES: winged helix-turn-helix domain-containing protein [Micromonospora]KWV31899.1 GntR family transcriptional regulator [Micromonospora rifamycinica]WFE97962.1 winged helix-turn-helix domain-containing protein [Micromonospora sp. WMMD987]SCG43449.1 regulatory protein, gntR family [Micromonospora rifamycinica]
MIDPDGPVPVYRQVANILAGRISNGDLVAHRPIPSEAAIVQEFGVARGTARRAVAELRERGLVYTVPQRGTYVGQPEA